MEPRVDPRAMEISRWDDEQLIHCLQMKQAGQQVFGYESSVEFSMEQLMAESLIRIMRRLWDIRVNRGG